MKAEAERREEVMNPEPEVETPTDMGFLELVNERLDYVKEYNCHKHYQDCFYLAQKWIKRWGELRCSQITKSMVMKYVFERKQISSKCANKEIKCLRATFNYGIKNKLIFNNPVDGIEFLPVKKNIKYVPPAEDVDNVIKIA